VGAESVNPKTLEMMELSNPDLDFVQIALGMGVKADRAETAEQFNELYLNAMKQKGPRLIEAVMP
jgi:acetolactate synthase-1/2/3 large subunit